MSINQPDLMLDSPPAKKTRRKKLSVATVGPPITGREHPMFNEIWVLQFQSDPKAFVMAYELDWNDSDAYLCFHCYVAAFGAQNRWNGLNEHKRCQVQAVRVK